MKKNTLTRILTILALLGVVFGSLGLVSPVLAQTPEPVDPAQPDPAVTVVVPDTGGDADNDGFAISGWTLLVILGIFVVILMIALVSRGSHTHTVD